MSDLKPCPFCGSLDVATQHCDEVSNVCCDNCQAGYWTSDGEDAESIWNNRASRWRSLTDDEPPRTTVFARSDAGIDGARTYGVLWYFQHDGVGHWHAVGEDGDIWDSLTIDVAEAGCPFAEWMEIPS